MLRLVILNRILNCGIRMRYCLKAEISYHGVTRVETYPFPKDAIREAVFNAIAHKFYGALIPIQISVYADKIYIANDCIFPEDWTIDDLMGKHRSRPYNPEKNRRCHWRKV